MDESVSSVNALCAKGNCTMELSTTYNPSSAYRSNLDQARPLQPEGTATAPREPSATSSSSPDSREDKVSIGSANKRDGNATYSARGLLNGEEKETTVPGQEPPEASETEEEKSAEAEKSAAERKPDGQEYTREEQEKITKLKDRDREVRAHEQAHVAAGGQYVRSAAQFQYQTGPDGQRYAVGGEVSIDVSKEGEPEATAAKMQVVIRAALAPAEPSGQDRAVAAQAVRTASEARMEAAAESRDAAGQKTGPENKEDPGTKTEDKALPSQNTGIDLFA